MCEFYETHRPACCAKCWIINYLIEELCQWHFCTLITQSWIYSTFDRIEWHIFWWHLNIQTQHMKFDDLSAADLTDNDKMSIYKYMNDELGFILGLPTFWFPLKLAFTCAWIVSYAFFLSAKHSLWNGITVKYHWDNGRICAFCYLIKISKNHWIVLRIPSIWNIAWSCSKRDLFFPILVKCSFDWIVNKRITISISKRISIFVIPNKFN